MDSEDKHMALFTNDDMKMRQEYTIAFNDYTMQRDAGCA